MQQWISCPNCGSPNLGGQPFCAVCGYVLGYNCPNCGFVVNNTFANCPNCRVSLFWPAPGAVPVGAKPQRKQYSWLIACLGLVGVAIIVVALVFGTNSGSDMTPVAPPASPSAPPASGGLPTLPTAPTAPQSGQSSGTQLPVGVDVPESPAAYTTAEALFGAYESDEEAANMKYYGKIISITGIVSSVGKDLRYGNPYVLLTPSQWDYTGVFCMFQKKDEAAVSKLKAGRFVSIQGRCDGYSTNVMLSNCMLKLN